MTPRPVPRLTRSTLWFVWLLVGLLPWWVVDALTADVIVPLSIYLVLHAYIYYAAVWFAWWRVREAPKDVVDDEGEDWRTA